MRGTARNFLMLLGLWVAFGVICPGMAQAVEYELRSTGPVFRDNRIELSVDAYKGESLTRVRFTYFPTPELAQEYVDQTADNAGARGPSMGIPGLEGLFEQCLLIRQPDMSQMVQQQAPVPEQEPQELQLFIVRRGAVCAEITRLAPLSDPFKQSEHQDPDLFEEGREVRELLRFLAWHEQPMHQAQLLLPVMVSGPAGPLSDKAEQMSPWQLQHGKERTLTLAYDSTAPLTLRTAFQAMLLTFYAWRMDNELGQRAVPARAVLRTEDEDLAGAIDKSGVSEHALESLTQLKALAIKAQPEGPLEQGMSFISRDMTILLRDTAAPWAAPEAYSPKDASEQEMLRAGASCVLMFYRPDENGFAAYLDAVGDPQGETVRESLPLALLVSGVGKEQEREFARLWSRSLGVQAGSEPPEGEPLKALFAAQYQGLPEYALSGLNFLRGMGPLMNAEIPPDLWSAREAEKLLMSLLLYQAAGGPEEHAQWIMEQTRDLMARLRAAPAPKAYEYGKGMIVGVRPDPTPLPRALAVLALLRATDILEEEMAALAARPYLDELLESELPESGDAISEAGHYYEYDHDAYKGMAVAVWALLEGAKRFDEEAYARGAERIRQALFAIWGKETCGVPALMPTDTGYAPTRARLLMDQVWAALAFVDRPVLWEPLPR